MEFLNEQYQKSKSENIRKILQSFSKLKEFANFDEFQKKYLTKVKLIFPQKNATLYRRIRESSCAYRRSG